MSRGSSRLLSQSASSVITSAFTPRDTGPCATASYLRLADLAFPLQQPRPVHAFEGVNNRHFLPFPDLVTKICTAIHPFPGDHKFLSHEKRAGLESALFLSRVFPGLFLFLSGSMLCLPGLRHMERLYIQSSVWGWGSRGWSLLCKLISIL